MPCAKCGKKRAGKDGIRCCLCGRFSPKGKAFPWGNKSVCRQCKDKYSKRADNFERKAKDIRTKLKGKLP